MKRSIVVIAFAAGLAGGLTSHWIAGTPSDAAPPAAVSAQKAAEGHEPRRMVAGGFMLVDAQGKERATLEMHPTGPRLTMFDAKGTPRLTLDCDDKKGPAVQLYDQRKKSRLCLGFAHGRDPAIQVNDASGRPQVQAMVRRQRASLWVRGSLSGCGVSLLATREQSTLCSTSPTGTIAFQVRTHRDGAPEVWVANAKNKTLWQAPGAKRRSAPTRKK